MTKIRKFAGILTLALLLTACGKQKSEEQAAPEITEVTGGQTTAAQEQQSPVMLYRTKEDGTAALQGYDTVRAEAVRPAYEDEMQLPAEVDGLKVTAIDAEGFAGADYFRAVLFPDTLGEMGDGCFRDSSLGIFDICDFSPITIGNDAFADCKKLNHVGLALGTLTFGDNAFIGCSTLKDLTISEIDMTSGEYFCAGLENLTDVGLDGNITLGSGSFSDCPAILDANHSNGKLTLGDDCFARCSGLDSFSFIASEMSFGKDCFAQCSIRNVMCSDCTGGFGEGCFRDCTNLEYLSISDGVTSIGSEAFAGCPALHTAIIPASVTEIGEGAFAGCESLVILTPEGSCAAQYADTYGISHTEEGEKFTIPVSEIAE